MWIIRFHLLEPKHYNKIGRIYKKYAFSPRSISGIVFAKSSLLHHTQKISWRAIGKQFGVDHVALYRFDISARESCMLKEIFHMFQESGVALYIGDKKTVSIQDLHNSDEIYNLTKREFESMLEK